MNQVTLQINVTADDVRHCKYLLHHQFDIFYEQVSEVLLTYDKQPRKTANKEVVAEEPGCFRGVTGLSWSKYPKVKLQELDYLSGYGEEGHDDVL